MKICILTQPLYTNYGGILQNYALQTVLKEMGHDVWTENRQLDKLSFYERLRRISIIRRIFGKSKYPSPSIYYKRIIGKYTYQFIDKYIKLTKPTNTKNIKEVLDKYTFDAYIVGSDQVWRPSYSRCITNYFLDFVTSDNTKRIAYAASFGFNKWEFNEEETYVCSNLLKKFDMVSVREHSAVFLCDKYFKVNAVHVLDPTMLLDKEYYKKLIPQNTIKDQSGLMVYILDTTLNKKKLIDNVKNILGLKTIELNPPIPEDSFFNLGPQGVHECIFPPVEDWLQGFLISDFVITDSFHGMVFSIIFNKPFVVIANRERGLDRFTSLLHILGLENRLISENDNIEDIIINDIDWNFVNKELTKNRKYSLEFLKKALS